ncbi:MAG: carbamate kinase [Pseudomonadota bacterium]
MRVVAALGGNALLRRGEPLSPEAQRRNVAAAARAIAEIAESHDVVVTHGNGPQVGLLALQAARAAKADGGGGDWPLDVLGAESEGMIGYLIERELVPRLPGRRIATLLTQVVVDRSDPAFARPTKPIGPIYDEAEAGRLARARRWTMAPDPAGKGWRRVVASPEPQRIVEIATIRHLVAEGFIVICAGGGGIPVAETPGGGLAGVEAVIDKDRSSALLARDIGADVLLLLTDVPGIYRGFSTESAVLMPRVDAAELPALGLDAGSMGPKAEAAARFAAAGGIAVIGRMEDAAALLAGRAGTRVTSAP